MGEGIRILFDGMYEAIRTKADQEQVPFAQILRRELIEIPQINSAISSSNVATLKLFYGLNEMALPHFEDVLARSRGAISKSEFMAGVEEFIAVLDEVENYNLTVPAASPSNKQLVASRAAAVGKWIVNRFAMGKSKVA
jgi:hypothetical protein